MATAQDEKQIAARYVTALFALAKEQKKLDIVAEELNKLAELAQESKDFSSLCQSPAISRQAKLQAIQAITKKIKLSALTSQFLAVLAENQRLAALSLIAEEFTARLRQHKGEAVAKVYTALPLDSKTEKSLTTLLEKYTGKSVVLSIHQKPEILGGLKIYLGGVMIDASLAGKLNRLKDSLNHGIRHIA